MKYVEALLKNEMYLCKINNIEYLEEDRVFCKHGFSHLLDVCRIAYIMNLEYQLGLDKEMIYLCGLLHDVGRGEEYYSGLSHEQVGMVLADKILEEIDCPKSLKEQVIKEIGKHRDKPEDISVVTAENVFWHADKKARNCFLCIAKEKCNWSQEKRTRGILW